MMRIVCALSLLFFALIGNAQQVPEGFIAEELVGGLNPTTMAFAPDGRLYITQKNGQVWIYDGTQLLPDPFITVEVDVTNERGLSGIVFHPEYEQNNLFYLYYTVPGENRNRLSRFTANGDVSLPGSEEILLELDPLSGTIHNGGAMVFGNDGKLYLAVGDGANPDNSQSFNNLLGKILRLNPDGTIPEDNPFYNSANGVNRAIYALGFRNPFTMTISKDGRIFVNDVGQETWEEVNEILEGANYGWPQIEGRANGSSVPDNYMDPVHVYNHDDGCAILGGAFYDPDLLRFPERYHGMYFYADYCEGYINVIDPDSGELLETFATSINRPLALQFASDGSLFMLERAGQGGGSVEDNTETNDGSLWQIIFTDNGLPCIGKSPESVTVSVGEDAYFFINASGAEPLTYTWFMNDEIVGENSPELVLNNVALADNGAVIICQVENDQGMVVSDPAILGVTDNRRPEPVITQPSTNAMYRAGDIISFAGTASDPEDGDLSAEDLTWWIDFHHDQHTHPALDPVSNISEGSFEVPRVGEISSNVWFRIYLRAEDSEGLTRTTYTEVYPHTSEVSILSDPPGLLVNADGRDVISPFDYTGVEGVIRTVAPARSQFRNGKLYVFAGWPDNSDETLRSFTTPTEDSVISIPYIEVPLGEGEGLTGRYYNQSRSMEGAPDLIRNDTEVFFDWLDGAPAPEIGADNFTVRWDGQILAPISGLFTFTVVADDGVRLFINNNVLVNAWVPQAATEYRATMELVQGELYDVRIEYFEDGGQAVMKFLWEHELLNRQAVPMSQLFPVDVTSSDSPITDNLAVYPIPASDRLFIFAREPVDQWILRDALGRSMKVPAEETNHGYRLDVEKLPAGIYYLELMQSQEKEVIRVLIN